MKVKDGTRRGNRAFLKFLNIRKTDRSHLEIEDVVKMKF